MFRRYSVRNLNEDAIDMLADIKAEERREFGAILEDCIGDYWRQIFDDAEEGTTDSPEVV